MFRCVLAEVFSLGGGHALTGALPRAAAWTAAVVVCVLLGLWTPWAVWLLVAVRLASIVEAGRRGRRGPIDGRWHWKPALLFFCVSLGFFIAVRTAALEAFRIPSAGMAPTLSSGDYIVGDKLSLLWRAPSRGEVVVFRRHGIDFIGRIVALEGDAIAVRGGVLHVGGKAVPQRSLGEGTFTTRDDFDSVRRTERVKVYSESLAGHSYRIILTDEVEFDSGDFPTDENRCDAAEHGVGWGNPLDEGPDGTCLVRRGDMFIVGDNRNNSSDSRVRGAFPVSSVRARVVGVWLGGDGEPFARIGGVE